MAEVASPSREVSAEWRRCPACEAFVYHKRLKRNLGVCPECNHHFRLRIRERLAQLLDEGSFEELSGDLEPVDALSFVDTKPYPERIAQAQRKTGFKSGALYGTGTIDGLPIVVAGHRLRRSSAAAWAARWARRSRARPSWRSRRRTPLLVISASGGARMQEGCVSLMQMAKTSQAVGRLNEEGVLYISLLTDPTYGGVSASFATLGDVLIAEPGAHIGFAGAVGDRADHPPEAARRLPDGRLPAWSTGCSTSSSRARTCGRTIRNLLELHAQAEAASRASDAPRAIALARDRGRRPSPTPSARAARDPWDVVQLARHIDRPRTLDYIGLAFDDFQELHGDRLFEEDAAIVGGLARLGDLTVMLIGHQKGHTTSEMMEHNFGMPEPDGYRKGMRLMRYAAKFGMPVVTLVDTPGAYPGARRRGARPVERDRRVDHADVAPAGAGRDRGHRRGGSGGALALAAGDRVLMLENSYYSVISPEGCATILFKDAAAAPRAAAALRITAPTCCACA